MLVLKDKIETLKRTIQRYTERIEELKVEIENEENPYVEDSLRSQQGTLRMVGMDAYREIEILKRAMEILKEKNELKGEKK